MHTVYNNTHNTCKNESPGELSARMVGKYSDFGRIERYISETVQDRRYVSINH